MLNHFHNFVLPCSACLWFTFWFISWFVLTCSTKFKFAFIFERKLHILILSWNTVTHHLNIASILIFELIPLTSVPDSGESSFTTAVSTYQKKCIQIQIFEWPLSVYKFFSGGLKDLNLRTLQHFKSLVPLLSYQALYESVDVTFSSVVCSIGAYRHHGVDLASDRPDSQQIY